MRVGQRDMERLVVVVVTVLVLVTVISFPGSVSVWVMVDAGKVVVITVVLAGIVTVVPDWVTVLAGNV